MMLLAALRSLRTDAKECIACFVERVRHHCAVGFVVLQIIHILPIPTQHNTMASSSAVDGVTAPGDATTTSVAILVGSSPGSAAGAAFSEISVAVWVCQERGARQSMADPWKYTLEYFEFMDDTARWTHLDQLLLRYPPQSLHVASSEAMMNNGSSSSSGGSKSNSSSAASKAKQQRRERLMQNLQVFLEERQSQSVPLNSSDSEDEEGNNNDNNNNNDLPPACHLHTNVPADSTKIESAVSQILLQDSDVQVAYRGNLELFQGKLLQQGLALWLQAEELYPPSVVPNQWSHSLKIQPGVLNSHLVMDRTAASCIHLLPPANAGVATVVGGRAHNNSLWGLLSQHCATSMGKAKLQIWLRQPLIDLAAILYRQNAVTALVQSTTSLDRLQGGLRAFTGVDLGQLASVLAQYAPCTSDDDNVRVSNNNTKRPLKALYQLYLLSASQLPALLEVMEGIMENNHGNGSQLLQDSHQQLVQLMAELDRCQGLVEAVLDLDSAPREYLIKPSFSARLQELYQELAVVQDQVDDELATVQESWAQATGSGDKNVVRLEECVVNNSADGSTTSSWQFRVPDTNGAKIVETLPGDHGMKMHRVLKNGVYFSTRTLRQLSAQYQQVTSEYSNHSGQVVHDAMRVATTYQTVVERAAQLVSTLDVILALARTAAYSPHEYCKPELTDSEENGAGIELKAARHPCVELQDNMEYIPSDVSMKLNEDSSQNFLLVTGPNMGGKSTYIRALGAVVCLAQIGAYVPATSATINICHALLARVGAGDLQERGISTFMAEMLEASSILRTATKRSLIIIDELGRGTSTFDGYGLAKAISEYLQRRIGCMTVFATHFHELTHMPGIQNCHVTAQKHTGSGDLTFLYQVRPGPCLESFGIQVAEMAKVPRVVIQDAKRMAADLEHFGSSKRQRVADRQFVQRFGALDIPSLLRQYKNGSGEEPRAKLLEMLVA